MMKLALISAGSFYMDPETAHMDQPPTDEDSFKAWLDHLAGTRPVRGEASLSHARAFFDALGSPQNVAPAVHIVGTAGKGTIAHLVTKRLVDRSLSVGTHMSPHVYDVRERFLLDGQLPKWHMVLGAARDVYQAAQHVETTTGRPPSFFAATAAMSWMLARRANADVLVVEAGIGGRHDATNVIDRPDRVVVVSRIGLDHTDVLGTTPIEIAAGKVAVIAGSAGVVLAPQSETGIERVVFTAAEAAGVDVVVIEPLPDGDWRSESDAAAAAVEKMITGDSAPPLAASDLPPGRVETFDAGGRTYVLDGAHNAVKLTGLMTSIRQEHPAGIQCVVAALGKHKGLDSCAAALAKMAPLVIVTSFGADPDDTSPTPRSWPAERLARAVADQSDPPKVMAAPDVSEAMEQARANTSEGGAVLVTGSFLYLAEARRAIR